MIYLKISNNKGQFRLDGKIEKWIDLDQINKEQLLILINLAVQPDFEMEEYKSELLENPAHNIIYKNIHGKFIDFLSNKTRFQDTAASLYKSAIEKYKAPLPDQTDIQIQDNKEIQPLLVAKDEVGEKR